MAQLAIGTLRLGPGGRSWLFQYTACGHSQEFPHDEWLASREDAERQVWRYYATCLTCRLDQRLKQYQLPTSRPKAAG